MKPRNRTFYKAFTFFIILTFLSSNISFALTDFKSPTTKTLRQTNPGQAQIKKDLQQILGADEKGGYAFPRLAPSATPFPQLNIQSPSLEQLREYFTKIKAWWGRGNDHKLLANAVRQILSKKVVDAAFMADVLIFALSKGSNVGAGVALKYFAIKYDTERREIAVGALIKVDDAIVSGILYNQNDRFNQAVGWVRKNESGLIDDLEKLLELAKAKKEGRSAQRVPTEVTAKDLVLSIPPEPPAPPRTSTVQGPNQRDSRQAPAKPAEDIGGDLDLWEILMAMENGDDNWPVMFMRYADSHTPDQVLSDFVAMELYETSTGAQVLELISILSHDRSVKILQAMREKYVDGADFDDFIRASVEEIDSNKRPAIIRMVKIALGLDLEPASPRTSTVQGPTQEGPGQAPAETLTAEQIFAEIEELERTKFPDAFVFGTAQGLGYLMKMKDVTDQDIARALIFAINSDKGGYLAKILTPLANSASGSELEQKGISAFRIIGEKYALNNLPPVFEETRLVFLKRDSKGDIHIERMLAKAKLPESPAPNQRDSRQAPAKPEEAHPDFSLFRLLTRDVLIKLDRLETRGNLAEIKTIAIQPVKLVSELEKYVGDVYVYLEVKDVYLRPPQNTLWVWMHPTKQGGLAAGGSGGGYEFYRTAPEMPTELKQRIMDKIDTMANDTPAKRAKEVLNIILAEKDVMPYSLLIAALNEIKIGRLNYIDDLHLAGDFEEILERILAPQPQPEAAISRAEQIYLDKVIKRLIHAIADRATSIAGIFLSNRYGKIPKDVGMKMNSLAKAFDKYVKGLSDTYASDIPQERAVRFEKFMTGAVQGICRLEEQAVALSRMVEPLKALKRYSEGEEITLYDDMTNILIKNIREIKVFITVQEATETLSFKKLYDYATTKATDNQPKVIIAPKELFLYKDAESVIGLKEALRMLSWRKLTNNQPEFTVIVPVSSQAEEEAIKALNLPGVITKLYISPVLGGIVPLSDSVIQLIKDGILEGWADSFNNVGIIGRPRESSYTPEEAGEDRSIIRLTALGSTVILFKKPEEGSNKYISACAIIDALVKNFGKDRERVVTIDPIVEFPAQMRKIIDEYIRNLTEALEKA